MPLTRGPLPARVYWTRRLVVLGLPLLLVLGIARVLGAGSDASSSEERATPVAADQTTSTGSTTGPADSTGPTATRRPHQPGKHHTRKEPVLAEPDGPCADEDVVVVPEVEDAVGGRDVTFTLSLQTHESEACTWQVSPQTVTLKIISGKDDIWSSRECPRTIPTEDVVVRRDEPTSVDVTWNAKRSDEECSRQTQWAMPGYYHVVAAALAGEPTDEQFELQAPSAPVITRTPEPHQGGKSGSSSASPSDSSSASVD
jgi:hypothetical protein